MGVSGQLLAIIVLPLGKFAESHCTLNQVGPKAGPDIVEKRFPAPVGNRISTLRGIQPVLQSLYRLSYASSHTEAQANLRNLGNVNCPYTSFAYKHMGRLVRTVLWFSEAETGYREINTRLNVIEVLKFHFNIHIFLSSKQTSSKTIIFSKSVR
jgi:hypothetical protein